MNDMFRQAFKEAFTALDKAPEEFFNEKMQLELKLSQWISINTALHVLLERTKVDPLCPASVQAELIVTIETVKKHVQERFDAIGLNIEEILNPRLVAKKIIQSLKNAGERRRQEQAQSTISTFVDQMREVEQQIAIDDANPTRTRPPRRRP